MPEHLQVFMVGRVHVREYLQVMCQCLITTVSKDDMHSNDASVFAHQDVAGALDSKGT